MNWLERWSNLSARFHPGWVGQRDARNPFVAPAAPQSVHGRRGPAALAARLARAWRVGVVLLALACTHVAAAYDEADAGLLRADVLEMRHEPAVVPPHSQWNATLVLRPGHAIVAAQYQVCRVGQACFAPPAPAGRVGNDTFRFDTAQYLAGGHPVDYQAGWRIGVVWILSERTPSGPNATRTVTFPEGPSAADPACAGDAQALACQERHYLAFDMPPATQGASGPGLAGVLLVVVVLALVGRSAGRHG
jgi:hypothetical protein